MTNTSYPACSGGSSGGKILLAANKVIAFLKIFFVFVAGNLIL